MASIHIARLLQVGQTQLENASSEFFIPLNDDGTAVQVTFSSMAPIVVTGDVTAYQGGIWNINNVTGTISLPTGASTSALQIVGNASLASIDSKFNTLGQKTMANSTPVVIASDQSAIPVTLSSDIEIGAVEIKDGTTNTRVVVKNDGVDNALVVTQNSQPLPTGAATEATLSTLLLNSTFTSRINTLGQKTMANSTPVVIASDQSPVPVSLSSDIEIGAVELKNGTDDTRAVIKTDGVDNALVVTQNSQPLPTGAATSANQTNGSQLTRITDGVDIALVTASGELNVLATAQPGVDIGDVTVNNAAGAAAVNIQDGGNSITVDGTVTANQGTSPWVISGTVTAAGTQDTNLIQVAGNSVNTGTGVAGAGTQRVAVASDSSINAVQSGTWNINNITGTVSLPTGAATSANQTNGTQQTKITDGTDITLVTAAGELNVISTAQPGVDIGDVTVNNAAGAGAVNIQDGGNSITVDGSVAITGTVDVSDRAARLLGTINNAAGASAVNIQDGGNSITVDGSVTANAGTNLNTSLLALDSTLTNKTQFTKITDGTDTALVTAAGELNVLATAQPGIDIGDVTINNAAGASAVNIQDGGNSITIDGTVAVSNAFLLDATFTSRINTLGQKTMANSTPVVIASDQSTLTVKDDHLLIATVTYATTDAFANARTDIDVQHYLNKTIVINNTGTKTARVTVLGSVDAGTNFDITLSNNTSLAAGNILTIQDLNALTTIRIQAKSNSAGNSTNLDTRGYAL